MSARTDGLDGPQERGSPDGRPVPAAGTARVIRHPAEVTVLRLLKHYERWFKRFEPDELIALSKVRHALWRIAEEDQGLRKGTRGLRM